MDNKPKTKKVAITIKEYTASVAKDKAIQVGVKTKDAVNVNNGPLEPPARSFRATVTANRAT